ncbi:unnamed protein product [Bubo scandiacus]
MNIFTSTFLFMSTFLETFTRMPWLLLPRIKVKLHVKFGNAQNLPVKRITSSSIHCVKTTKSSPTPIHRINSGKLNLQILQVNKVMSILFYVIFLAYLRGIQSTNMDQRSLPEDSINSLIIKLIQADILKNKLSKQMVDIKENYQNTVQKADTQQDMDGDENVKSDFQPVISMDTDLLRQQRRYNSPRVLLSDNTPLEPPPLYLMEDYIGNSVVVNRTSRRKRYAEHKSHRGEYSVCDSESLWVTDKSSAIDIRGHQVTVLGEIKTGNSPVKQYFYETRCKEAKPVKNGCRGIDDKHWNSQCKTSQTYVRALTSENNKLVGWRWIRIDTSCVCALSRKIGRT